MGASAASTNVTVKQGRANLNNNASRAGGTGTHHRAKAPPREWPVNHSSTESSVTMEAKLAAGVPVVVPVEPAAALGSGNDVMHVLIPSRTCNLKFRFQTHLSSNNKSAPESCRFGDCNAQMLVTGSNNSSCTLGRASCTDVWNPECI
jgi:hypothetical protein